MPRARARAPVLGDAGDLSVARLRGVGPARAQALAARGFTTCQDLWFYLPRTYEDRTRITPISALRVGESAQVEGEILSVERSFRARAPVRILLADGSGMAVGLRFFNSHPSQFAAFAKGARIRAHGTARPGAFGLEIHNPSYQLLGETATALGTTLDPVYPESGEFKTGFFKKLIAQALEHLPGNDALELLPAHAHAVQNLSVRDALLTLHRPPADINLHLLAEGRHPAQRRLAFEELLAHQLSLRIRREALRGEQAIVLASEQRLAAAFVAQLPFALTPAQTRVVAEVRADLIHPKPMLRLVQGDVGSGKTVVAALAALAAVECGQQAALMAPTELLAEQHANTLRAWFEPLGVQVAWLAGKVKGRARTNALDAIASGAAQVVVGTHALMQAGIEFHALALAIVDEQHRFGVRQRLALREKGGEGRIPHQLVMTATPIPRTLAMSAYADLDVSVIDALPPGRTPVQTVVIAGSRRAELIQRIGKAVGEGRQVYWVCTLIEDSDEIQAQAAETTHATLSEQLPGARVGLVHGRMKPDAKQAVMAQFKAGALDVLVATTVIEVGVDVPNASLMVIENAERLGLAQLHQLRGRVGRGTAASTCVLMYAAPLGAMARARLDTMRTTTDGFVIAERDLQLRGPGELLGTRQTGLMSLRIADLTRDADLLPAVQALAGQLVACDPATAHRLIARWVGQAVQFAGA